MGFVGAFEQHGRVIGTIRLIPIGQGLAPCESIVARHPELPAELFDGGWEVGRLVLDPEFRSQPDVLKNCFFLTLMRFIEETPVANFFATCNPLLSRLYRRFGFSVLVKDACQREGESYSLIHGNVPSVELAVAQAAAAERGKNQ
jgi:predicted GNAT family N-acyltransferase